jgi:hypothetical protein
MAALRRGVMHAISQCSTTSLRHPPASPIGRAPQCSQPLESPRQHSAPSHPADAPSHPRSGRLTDR